VSKKRTVGLVLMGVVAVAILAAGCAVAPGNPNGQAPIPPGAGPADTSRPTRVVGDGTPTSCTSAATVSAIALGGIITFNCGPSPITITLTETAKIRNLTGPDIVIDGGGKVTLSGGGQRRILYMNTCEAALGLKSGSDCTNQNFPRLVVQNLTFTNGNAIGQPAAAGGGSGGGAIYVRGGRVRVVNSKFTRNICEPTGQDLGGGAVRVLSQYNGLPVYVVNSTFGGAAGDGNSCSNGGALSSVWVSWTVLNSVFSFNTAVGNGGNPMRAGSPGGGLGGAIYNDGRTMQLNVAGTIMEDNHAIELGGAIFFVSNDLTGTMGIDSSTLRRNPNDYFQQPPIPPGIFFLGTGSPVVTNSTITP
jgi:hypothetical protein